MKTGSRKEIVRSVGFRFGNVRRPPFRQSMNSVESWFAQNSRSSSSDRNSGTGFIFVFGISISFSSIHVPNGDYAHQRTADGERHEQASPTAGLPKGVVPFLPPGVADVAAHDQGLVEEHVLSLFRADSMAVPVFLRVGFVPFKTGTGIEWIFAFRHITSIYLPYTRSKTSQKSGAQVPRKWGLLPLRSPVAAGEGESPIRVNLRQPRFSAP